MVSDFISEKDGYLQLTKEEYQEAKNNNPRIGKHARQTLEYAREGKEGYWTFDIFISQITEAAAIAETKYPREKGWKMRIFDHSCHSDTLEVFKMIVNPGGK